MRARVASLARAQEGQYLPIFAALLFALLILAFSLFQVGVAATFKSRVQTAADAAALAGEVQVKREIEAAFPESLSPAALMATLPIICAQAEIYALRNGAHVKTCTLEFYDVKVEVEGIQGIKSPGLSGRNDAKGKAHARASLGVSYAGGIGFGGLGGGGSGGGGATGAPGNNCMTDAEIAKVEDAAGVKVRSNSALRANCGDGNGPGRIDVRDLQLQLQVIIAKAEDKLGRPLSVSSGFRTAEWQRALCAQPEQQRQSCAAPGQSAHNQGAAIDVAGQDQGPLDGLADGLGLCHLGRTDSTEQEHFSLLSAGECGGGGGGGGGGGAGGGFGGGFGGFATYAVKLVPWKGGDFALPGFSLGPGGPWAIPWDVVACESGGRNQPPNYAGASGYYQFIPSTWRAMGGSTPEAYQASKEEQDRLAAKLWNMPGGPANWDCARMHGWA